MTVQCLQQEGSVQRRGRRSPRPPPRRTPRPCPRLPLPRHTGGLTLPLQVVPRWVPHPPPPAPWLPPWSLPAAVERRRAPAPPPRAPPRRPSPPPPPPPPASRGGSWRPRPPSCHTPPAGGRGPHTPPARRRGERHAHPVGVHCGGGGKGRGGGGAPRGGRRTGKDDPSTRMGGRGGRGGGARLWLRVTRQECGGREAARRPRRGCSRRR